MVIVKSSQYGDAISWLIENVGPRFAWTSFQGYGWKIQFIPRKGESKFSKFETYFVNKELESLFALKFS